MDGPRGERRGREYAIHYVVYPDSDNEVVPGNRVRFPFNDGAEERTERKRKLKK